MALSKEAKPAAPPLRRGSIVGVKCEIGNLVPAIHGLEILMIQNVNDKRLNCLF